MIQNDGATFWVHKNRAQRFATVHRADCAQCECGDAGCLVLHSYTAAWRSATEADLEATNCRACRPQL